MLSCRMRHCCPRRRYIRIMNIKCSILFRSDTKWFFFGNSFNKWFENKNRFLRHFVVGYNFYIYAVFLQYFVYVFLLHSSLPINFNKLAFRFFFFHFYSSVFPQSACIKLAANVVSIPWYLPLDIETALRLKHRAQLDVLRASSSMQCSVN